MSERCDECGYDSDGWNERDVKSLLGATASWWDRATAGVSDDVFLPYRSMLEAVDPHDVSHSMMDLAAAIAAIGAGTPAHTGIVEQVNSSKGGVPKLPTLGGAVGFRGLEGDQQHNRKHHGRPFQALCLYSLEVIDELASQGHSVGPGSTGENLTLSGIDWTALRPGTRMRIGTALAELSFPAVPCKKQTRWFTDGDFTRIAYERNPQWVRWYAWVREPGAVYPGDPVVISPTFHA